jgi:hypothetical protein
VTSAAAKERPGLHRYPRTKHLEGSAVQSGDEDMDLVPFAAFRDKVIVVSEKVDGANAAVSFTTNGRLLLQSRSRYLDDVLLEGRGIDGPYAGFREWAQEHEDVLWPVLRDRYVMFGEWALAKLTVFYDALPNAFLELDVLDKETGAFLSTGARRQLLRRLPLTSAPVIAEGRFSTLDELRRCIGPSRFKTPGWRDELLTAIADADVHDSEPFIRETDPSDDMEGLVVKLEADGVVVDRAKLVRDSFKSPGHQTSSQWLAARRVKNRLAAVHG